jgi:hypothetical protein
LMIRKPFRSGCIRQCCSFRRMNGEISKVNAAAKEAEAHYET